MLEGETPLRESGQLSSPQFSKPLAAEYREILQTLKDKGRDLVALSKRFQETNSRHDFH